MTFVAAGLLVLAMGAACGQAAAPTSPTSIAVSGDLETALQRSLQDEYRAEAIYQGVLTDLGQVLPFVNVLTAEQRHSTSIERLYTIRGAGIPASNWTLGNVPRFATVRQVFTNNRSASLVSPLPAFERCS